MSDRNLQLPNTPDINNGSGQSSKENEAVYVGWVPGSENAPRTSAPRLYHKKSKNGCQQCRARKVKCNEIHPVCGSCTRHQVSCIWGRAPSTSNSEFVEPKAYEFRPKSFPEKAPVTTETTDIPESTERRLLELKLLHHYMSSTCWTLNLSDDPILHELSIRIPQLAFKHEALLQAILTVAALHISKLEPNNPENIANYQRHLSLTLRSHQDEVANLNISNADSVCCTSSFMRLCAFAILQERDLTPYEPPIRWFQMYSAAGRIFPTAWKYISSLEDSVAMALILNAPGLKPTPGLRDKEVLFRDSNRKGLEYLLRRTEVDEVEEPWDDEIREVYENMVAYIGSVRIAIEEGEEENKILRRLLLFPMVSDDKFVEVVGDGKQRALVVLAHYFALLTRFREVWWIGDTGIREVRVIADVVGEQWGERMQWPLEVVKNVSIIT